VSEQTATGHATIVAALAAAQAEMGPALKLANNPAFRTRYADLASVMDACMPALNRHGIAVIQPTGGGPDDMHVETILLHASGQSLSCRVPLIVGKRDMQGYGSAVTYARRYGLMCMAGIAPEDDDGAAAAASVPSQDRRPAPRTPAPEAAAQPQPSAVDALARAATLADLSAIWRDLPPEVKRQPEVIAAKDARKDALKPPTEDEIQY